MRVQQQAAFVLHGRNYSETSLIVECFTAEHGRLSLLAKGARRRSSPFRGLLEPFQPLLIGFSARSDLGLLTAAESAGDALRLQGARLYCGFYMNELLMRLLHRHDPHRALFDVYARSLQALRDAEPAEAGLRLFEKHLLREIGYGLVLDREAGNDRPIVAEALYEYVPELGPVRIGAGGARERARGARVSGSSLIALAQERFADDAQLTEIKRLMRRALDAHLGPRPLNSRRLLREVLAARERAAGAAAPAPAENALD